MTTIHRTAARSLAVGTLALTLLLVGCGSDSSDGSAKGDATTTTTADETATEAITITDAWARKSPMNTTAGAAYMNLTAASDDALVGASVDPSIAGTVEIHETVIADDDSSSMESSDDMTTTTAMSSDDMTTTTAMGDDDEGMGTMTMQPVDSIELPAGETVSLEPGGYHVMLLDLAAPLEVGDTFELTLSFEHAPDQTITVEVREA